MKHLLLAALGLALSVPAVAAASHGGAGIQPHDGGGLPLLRSGPLASAPINRDTGTARPNDFATPPALAPHGPASSASRNPSGHGDRPNDGDPVPKPQPGLPLPTPPAERPNSAVTLPDQEDR
jgi:hypothetical protein